ncbi:uncharacterized protein N7482_000944 [Penicillium canariense]|uniref:GPI anchored protein n=1 Tax=Penicillium canariense TaxID=189055 RepID=A0A9W9LTM3_9EURO|nr:uncharacterized protein N7482_000944 [Penicillium canariense]KAJ5175067.1 hypothetical protein N7482_000944 [Penicillium canariense]
MKGFVGGIPIALLAAAAQAMEHSTQNDQGMQTRGQYSHPHVGGTAIGGPSGNDEDGGFTVPYGANVHAHTNVDEFSKDDHSVKVKDTNVYPPAPVPGPYGPIFGPGEGPFPKRSRYPHYGGTVIGGPSGNDEGQTFDMPMTADIHTNVDEYAKDDHSIKVKNKDIHPPPVFAPIGAPVHPPVGFPGPPAGFEGPPAGFREGANADGDYYDLPASTFEKRWDPEVGGTAMGGPSGGSSPSGFNSPFVSGGTAEGGPSGDDEGEDSGDPPSGFKGPFGSGGTAEGGPSGDDEGEDFGGPPSGFKGPFGHGATVIGGPSGDDGGQSFSNPITASVHTNVNEYSKDDHSINVKHKDVYPSPGPFGAPFKRGWEPEMGGTAMGGPSGDDGGQSFSAPITVDVSTDVHEHYEDDHSIDLQNTDVYPPPRFPPFDVGGGPGPYIPEGGAPFRRAYSPSRMADGGTAMGGPSGDDGGTSFGNPDFVGVDSNVNEHNEDNHAIKLDTTTVHHPHHAVPHMPWMPYPEEAPVAPSKPVMVPEEHPAPPAYATPEEPPASPNTPSQDHQEVPQCDASVHEVVRTVTKTKYKEVRSTETVYATPVVSQAVQTTAAVPMSAVPEQSSYVDPKVAYSASVTHPSEFASIPAAPSSSSAPSNSYNYMSQAPMSSSAAYSSIPVHIPMTTPSSSAMMSVATPSSSQSLPSGADPLHSASASPSPHDMMFTGSAARVSGGIASAVAAVMGVLALVL